MKISAMKLLALASLGVALSSVPRLHQAEESFRRRLQNKVVGARGKCIQDGTDAEAECDAIVKAAVCKKTAGCKLDGPKVISVDGGEGGNVHVIGAFVCTSVDATLASEEDCAALKSKRECMGLEGCGKAERVKPERPTFVCTASEEGSDVDCSGGTDKKTCNEIEGCGKAERVKPAFECPTLDGGDAATCDAITDKQTCRNTDGCGIAKVKVEFVCTKDGSDDTAECAGLTKRECIAKEGCGKPERVKPDRPAFKCPTADGGDAATCDAITDKQVCRKTPGCGTKVVKAFECRAKEGSTRDCSAAKTKEECKACHKPAFECPAAASGKDCSAATDKKTCRACHNDKPVREAFKCGDHLEEGAAKDECATHATKRECKAAEGCWMKPDVVKPAFVCGEKLEEGDLKTRCAAITDKDACRAEEGCWKKKNADAVERVFTCVASDTNDGSVNCSDITKKNKCQREPQCTAE